MTNCYAASNQPCVRIILHPPPTIPHDLLINHPLQLWTLTHYLNRSSYRSHRTHGTKRGKDVFTVTEELDALQAKHTETLQRLAVAEDRNQRLVEVVEQSKLKLKRLKSQADSLSPELIKELEDMRFALYQSQHMNSAYEKALRQLTRNLRLPYPKKQLAAMYATEGSDLSS
eukprot:m.234370 g.234370  ORF g.234370 m.234370 type:complete len:172 (+) comp15256_c1_seq7:125-640(+)